MTDQKPGDAANPFDAFAKVPANYVPLTPISFLERTAAVYGQRDGVIYGARRYSWAQVLERSQRLAAGLRAHGIGKGDVVSVMAANTPEMVEAHFGVPAAGAVLNAINTRLDIDTVAYILEHAGTKLLITDTHFSPIVGAALERLGDRAPQVIDIVDAQLPPPAGAGERLGQHTYEELLDAGAAHIDGAPSADGAAHWQLPGDEWDAITLNYTSGTSGRPKGVVYHHRGAYLMAIGTLAGWRLPALPRYLYVVPMFHCNGWGHVWTMALAGGTIFCHRVMTAKALFDALADNAITHFGAAPIILGTLVNAGAGERRDLPNTVYAMTAGAPPAPAVLAKTAELGIEVLHVYGLTETYGHVLGSFPQDDLDALSADDRAARMARQGVGFPMHETVDVLELGSGASVPSDGVTQGEIVLRGNTVMKGYFKDPEATEAAFQGGAFKSGDIAVRHPDGYVEIKDRLKDVIISGGENISSVEVEAVLYKHPAVANAAVVARPDEKWGETPCAFVELQPGTEQPSEADLIAFAREHLAGFKAPKHVRFGELPKTATGKIQKFVLRNRARSED